MSRFSKWWPAVRVPDVPPVAVLLPQKLRLEVLRLRQSERTVEAVRRVREQTGLGLLPAYMAVQAAQEELPREED
jgi:hypothetical protein